jgi:hypothetical protein
MFAIIIAGRAQASLPPIGNAIIPACITLVGSAGAVPATAFGDFQVVLRDLANNPVPNAAITIDLSGCRDLHLCADQLDPAATVDCAHKTVTKRTDASGTVHFTILGGSNGAGNAVTLLNGGKIFGDGLFLGSPTVSAFDLDGSNGVAVNDLSVWLSDFGSFVNRGRSDFDCTGAIGINDFSLLLAAYGSGTQITSCATSCP